MFFFFINAAVNFFTNKIKSKKKMLINFKSIISILFNDVANTKLTLTQDIKTKVWSKHNGQKHLKLMIQFHIPLNSRD